MSYSSDLKKQLLLSEIKTSCCAESELCAALLMNGSTFFLSRDKQVIRRIFALLRKSVGQKVSICSRVFYRKGKNGAAFWGVVLPLTDIENPLCTLSKSCCDSAFLRGCFLHSGYIMPPDKAARAEISFKNKTALQFCEAALERCGISYRIAQKNGADVIYIKSAEFVSEFLVRIGAVKAMLELENSRIIKKYKSEVNRVTNCDNANLDKTVSAALRQAALISEFMKTAAFEALPDQLKEIARLRVEHPSLTLKELGALLTPVLGKSGVAHRLKKLETYANSVKTMQ